MRAIAAHAVFCAPLVRSVLAKPHNTTMDDDPWPTDRASIVYEPASAWSEGQYCPGALPLLATRLQALTIVSSFSLSGCHAQPDKSQLYNGSWHDTTDDGDRDIENTTMTINFVGAWCFSHRIYHFD